MHIACVWLVVCLQLPIEGAEHAISSDEALHLEALPDKSVLIVGSG